MTPVTKPEISKPDAIIFDWDGTLVDTIDTILASYNAVFAEFDMPLWTLEDAKRDIRLSARDIFPVIFGGRAEEAKTIFYQAVEKNHLQHLKQMPAAASLLRHIHAHGIPIGIVSNKKTDFLRAEAFALGWQDYLGSLIGAGTAAKDKPEPDPVRLALSELGIKNPDAEIWFVGDTDVDMICAANSGCRKIFIKHGFGNLDEASEHHPDLVVKDCAGLIDVLIF